MATYRGSKRTKYVFKPRFYVICVSLFFVILAALVLFIPGSGQCVIAEGIMDTEVQQSFAVIRNEQVISVDKYDRIQHKVEEGSTVAAGTPVACVYKWGYSDDMMQALLQIEADIYEEQMTQLASVEDLGLIDVNNRIEVVKDRLQSAILNKGTEDVLTIENELTALLEERQAYLATRVQSTETLNALYQERATRLDQLNQWRTDVRTAADGRVSFYFDGYEQALNVAKLEIISTKLVLGAIKGSSATDPTMDSEKLLYRLVDPNVWYVAFITSGSDMYRVVEGERYEVSFSGESETTYVGIAQKPLKSGDSFINILKFERDIGRYISIRSIKGDISLHATGLTVNKDAILFDEDMLTYVKVKGSDKIIYVDILGIDGDNVLIRASGDSDVLAVGQTLVMSQKNLFSKLFGND